MYSTTLVIGASFAGLATAACLRRRKVDFAIIEKQPQVGDPWRHHYERLHLHTNKRVSGLPHQPWDNAAPRYPSRLEVIAYLEAYAQRHDIHPQFQTDARSVRPTENGWIAETNAGTFESKYVVMATGAFGKPKRVELPGQESFPGRLLHSSGYSTGVAFKGQRVLVVGFGNSACEIAMDLAEQGAAVSMAVRSAVNVIPRDIFGIPVLELSLVLQWLPPGIADAISAPLIRLTVGDVRRLGLRRKPFGPLEQIAKEGKAPVLDIGVIRKIRAGEIRICPGLDHIEGEKVFFVDGSSAPFDAIVAGIGFERNYEGMVEVEGRRFLDLRRSMDKQRYFGEGGLYFCGYWISPTGQIREIGRDAKRIAKDIEQRINV